MPIRKILVHLPTDGSSTDVLDSALAAAGRFGAHVEVLYVRPNPREMLPFVMGGPANVTEIVLEAAETSSREHARIARELFDGWRARNNVPLRDEPGPEAKSSVGWHEESGSVSDALVARGRVSDLTVVVRPTPESPSTELLEAALLNTGRPVLVVPPTGRKCVGSHAVIGWNASDEAARAVGMAMSCLKAAEKVTVVSGRRSSEQRRPRTEELVEYLAWHGIQAGSERFDTDHHPTGYGLLRKVDELGADLLVLGGYSHSRARELVTGGVTRHVLAESEVPVLMAH